MKNIFFHPMLYLAILLHWGIFNLPSPVDQSEDNEQELLDQSIPIASTASLGIKSKKSQSPQKSEQSQVKQTKKPNPLAEALVKSDPNLARLAEERKRREEEAKRKAEEKKKEAKRKKEEADKNKAGVTEESQSSAQADKNAEEQDKNADQNTQEEASGNSKSGTDEGENASDDGNETAQEFNLELLPKPELVFTSESLAAYNPGFNALEFQDNVEDARTLETTTSVDKAIQAISQLDEYRSFSFGEPIFDDTKNPEESGLGVVFEVQLEDSTKYVSFIRRSSRWARKNRKNTLRSTMVFVLWSENPLS